MDVLGKTATSEQPGVPELPTDLDVDVSEVVRSP
jgi:hypothetical protein